MFSKCVAAFLFLTMCLCGREVELRAKLRFLVWQPAPDPGLLIDGSQVQPQHPFSDLVHLQRDDGVDSVELRTLRTSPEVDYSGNGVVQLKRDDLLVAEFRLPRDGEYFVLLQPERDRYRSFPVELATLQQGAVYVINQTAKRYALKFKGARRVVIPAWKKSVVPQAIPERHACHLSVYCWQQKMWRPRFARFYSLKKKALCVLYQSADDQRLQVRFFSDL